MAAKIIDGKEIAQKIRSELVEEIKSLKEKGVTPGLSVVLVGENPASEVYVRMKNKAAHEIGVYSEQHTLETSASEEELLELIDKLNTDEKIHGILVQLPLPDQINEKKVLNRILPEKDVEYLWRFGLYLLIPLASWVGSALVERMVDVALD